MQFVQFCGLESRTLLSHGAAGEDPKPQPKPANLEADRAAILAAVAKCKADVEGARAVVTAAQLTQKTHATALAVQLKGLEGETRKDEMASKTVSANLEASVKSLKVKWSAQLSAEELDVKTDGEGETESERADDLDKLNEHRAAAKAELAGLFQSTTGVLTSLQGELKSDHAALEAARKAGAVQAKKDAATVAEAVKSMQSVFQSDRLVVEADMKLYRQHGGKMDGFAMPAMPKI